MLPSVIRSEKENERALAIVASLMKRRGLLKKRIEEMVDTCGEYSGMLREALEKKCKRPVIEWLDMLRSNRNDDLNPSSVLTPQE